MCAPIFSFNLRGQMLVVYFATVRNSEDNYQSAIRLLVVKQILEIPQKHSDFSKDNILVLVRPSCPHEYRLCIS